MEVLGGDKAFARVNEERGHAVKRALSQINPFIMMGFRLA